MSDGPFETDWAADVVHHKMAAIDPECVDRLAGPAGQATPRVVEIAGPLGQSETGEVEGNAAQPPAGQLRQDLAMRNELAGTPCRYTTGAPSPRSSTKLPTPPASNVIPDNR